MKKTVDFSKRFIELYTENNLAQSAAAMAYFFTMTVFPIIICLYTLLGNNYELAVRVLDFLENFLAVGTVQSLRGFVMFVYMNHSPRMLLAGLVLIVTSASSAMRALQRPIAAMQGGQRYEGFGNFLFSVVLSVAFVAAMYCGIMVMVTGNKVLDFLSEVFPFADIRRSWIWVRFVLFFGLALVIIWLVYAVSRRRREHYPVFPGALLAAVGLAAVSFFFSIFLSASTRYPMVYGSLASIILLIFWLFVCSLVILCGAAFNIVLRDRK